MTPHDILRNAIKWSCQINGTLHIVMSGSVEEMEKAKMPILAKAEKAINRGGTVVIDGKTVWVDDVEKFPAVWDKSGNKTKHDRYRVEKCRDGNISKTFVKTFYKSPDLV